MTNNEKIINEAKRIEEDSLYSAKAHFSAGHLWGVVNFWLGTISAVLSAMAGASALSQFFYHNIIAGVLSIIVAGLAAIITFINPDKRSIIYKGAGNKYKALQNNARIFYEIEVTTNGTDDKRNLDDLKKLNDLISEYILFLFPVRKEKLFKFIPRIDEYSLRIEGVSRIGSNDIATN